MSATGNEVYTGSVLTMRIYQERGGPLVRNLHTPTEQRVRRSTKATGVRTSRTTVRRPPKPQAEMIADSTERWTGTDNTIGTRQRKVIVYR